jgi:hypothetical protein
VAFLTVGTVLFLFIISLYYLGRKASRATAPKTPPNTDAHGNEPPSSPSNGGHGK